MGGPSGRATKTARSAAIALTIVTGFTGLVDEVAWQQALAVLLGSNGEAAAAVLAIFLGGLAVGYALFGRVSRRIGDGRRLLLLYGAVEAGVGAWALAFPWLFELARAASLALPASGAEGFAWDLLLAVLLLGPPTVLMGGTLPLLTQALARDLADATRIHALVYGGNAAGGFAGAVTAGFLLVPGLGIPGTLRAMGIVNLLVGTAFAGLARRAPEQAPSPPAEASTGPRLRVHAGAALLLGFAMIALQTVVIRVGGLAFGASDLTFAVVVATFVLCLALGSLTVAVFPRVPRAAVVLCPAAVAVLLAALYPALQFAPYAAHVLRVGAGTGDSAFLRYQLATSGLVLVVFAAPLALSGASLPILFHVLRRRLSDLGAVVGRLYAWNTVGSVLGALLGGHWLLLWLDLHHVYRLAVAAIALAAALLALGEPGSRRFRVLAGACTLALLGLLGSLAPWDPTELSTGYLRMREATAESFAGPAAMAAARGTRLVFADDDPSITVMIHDHPVDAEADDGRTSRALLTQGKSDGTLVQDYPTMALTGLIPCLLAEKCERAFVVGLGTGVTAGELAAVATMEQVIVAEISRAVIAAAPLFDHGNLGVSSHPRIEIIAGDAQRTLHRLPGSFDVIASEPSHPWASGVERLYTVEFLKAARARLAPGGVYGQWMHAYEMDAETLALVLRTFAAAFGDVAVWWASGPDLLLVGFADAARPVDVAAISALARRPDLRAGLLRAEVESPAALLAHELVPPGIVGPDTLPGPLQTLLHPRLARRAARAFFDGAYARLPEIVPPAASGRAEARSALGALAPRDDATFEAVVRETCGSRDYECATLLAWWQHERPGSAAPERVRAELEEALDPHLLPMRIETLRALYADGMLDLEPIDARRLTDHFRTYYHHGRPFRRAALDRSWDACRGEGCAAARRTALARLDGVRARDEGEAP